MYHIKLCKALSYYGAVQATKETPDVFIENKEIADKAIESGYFKMVEAYEKSITEDKSHYDRKQLEDMKLDELKQLAEDMGIDISGLKKKSDFIDAVTSEDNSEQ